MSCLHTERLDASDGKRPITTGVVISVLALLLVMASTAYAHRVVLFAWIEGDTVYTQSKFPGGAKVSEGAITVLDDAGRELLTGKTDRQGEFSFPLKTVPSVSAIKIVLNAGMGHQGSWELTREEVGRALGVDGGPSSDDKRPEDLTQPQPVRPEAAENRPVDNDLSLKSEAELRKIVEEAVDRKLSPVMEILISIREEMAIGLDDVVAGLGYILGLAGLLAWFYAGKKG